MAMLAMLGPGEIVVLAMLLTVLLVIPVLVGFAAGRSRSVGRSDPRGANLADVVEAVSHDVATSNRLLADRLKDAFDHIDQAVVIVDSDGNEVFLNAAAETLRESRDGRVLVENAAIELLRSALAGNVRTREVDLFGPPARTFSITARPLSGPAGVGALVIVEDITMRRLTETVRRDFVANISHELKSPIGAMGLLADMIGQESDPEVVERLSNRMVDEADRASRTIDDLLELASIEFAGEVENDEVTAEAIVRSAVERISSSAEQARVEILTVDEYGGTIIGDRLQLVSAIYNLLDNAIKYSPPGSAVEVHTRPSRFAGMIDFSVTDKGVGIPRRDLDRIFERFYRVDRARSRGTGGTGLGLAIVRHVANNHAGEVTVESIEGVGTTFILRIATAPPEHNGEGELDNQG